MTVKITIISNGKIIKKYSLSSSYFNKNLIIGSHSNYAQIVVEHPLISRKHLEFFIQSNGEIYIADLNSTNGTFVNGRKLTPGQRSKIQLNTPVYIGPQGIVQIIFSDAAASSPVQPKRPGGFARQTTKSPHPSGKICIGRSKECDVKLESTLISRKHAWVYKNSDGTYTIVDNNSTNGTYVNGRLVTGKKRINKSDVIKIGEYSFRLEDYLRERSIDSIVKNVKKTIDITQLLRRKRQVIIGRSKKADYVINDFSVSRFHAKITFENNQYFIEDLKSINGTFVNNRRITGKTRITENDTIRISFKVFKLTGETTDISEFSAIKAENITKVFPTKTGRYVAVKPVSFSIPSKSFIALMGPSGCGKSTLMNMLNGFNPATSGKVYIHGLELISNIDLLKQKIGFVPQDDIVHKDLTVDKALFYAAKLRMNKDATDQEILDRIDAVCRNLKITKEQRQNYIKKLSGGQRKRISIAVELLNKPTILFLDEPTSPLDPETIDSFLTSLRDLAQKEDTTIVMVTHKPEDLKYVDRVIFLGTEGYPAYYGNEQDMYDYFNVDNIVKIYSKLSDKKEAAKWYENFNSQKQDEKLQVDDSGVAQKQKTSAFKQFYWLTKRYARLKWNDKQNMILLLLQPLLIPLALVFIYEKLELGILFLMAITSIWFGVSNAAKEIVEEIPIYLRERMFNLKIFPYIFSKISVLSLIAFVQIILYISVLSFKYDSGQLKLVNVPKVFMFMFFLTVSATLLGLLLSVIFKTSEQVMSIIPIVLIPQIIFAGVISDIDTKNKEILSYFMFGRWGTEALARIQSDHKDYKTYQFRPDDELVILNNEEERQQFELVKVEDVCNDGTSSDIINCSPQYKSVYQKQPKVFFTADTLKVIDEPENKSRLRPLIINGEKVYTEPIKFTKGKKYVKVAPIDVLGYYKNKDLLNKFNSLKKNIYAILMIDALLFILILVYIKKKDRI